MSEKQTSGSPWIDSLDQLDALLNEERLLWLYLGITDFDWKTEHRVLAAHRSRLDKKEEKTIARIVAWESLAKRKLMKLLGKDDLPPSPIERARAAVVLAPELDKKRAQLLATVLSQVEQKADEDRSKRKLAQKPARKKAHKTTTKRG